MEPTIFVAIIGAFAVIITTSLSISFSKKNQIKFEERKLKEVYYTQFIKAFSDNINNENEKSGVIAICYAQNNLFLIASIDVIISMQHFDEMCVNNGSNYEAETGIKKGSPEFKSEYNRRLRALMISMRKDLYGKKEVLYPIIHFKTARK